MASANAMAWVGSRRSTRRARDEIIDADMRERGQRPAHFDRTVVLRDGTRVRMRPIRPDDAARLVALYDQLSRDTRYHRFFSVMGRLAPDWVRFLANVD